MLRLTLCLMAATALTAAEVVPPVLPFDTATLTLIDEVDLGAVDPGHDLRQHPEGIAVRAEILGRSCLTIPNQIGSRETFVAVRLGKGKGLKALGSYILQIEYPEDVPRSMIVQNSGNEAVVGFHTGNTLGDALRTPYVYGNPEAIAYPLSGKWQTWTSLFELQPRYPDLCRPRGGSHPRDQLPADGITVVLGHFAQEHDPLSKGIAAAKVRLYAAPEPKTLALELKLPPEGLPRRHVFWREEMADGVVSGRDYSQQGYDEADSLQWYAAKMRQMQFLGFDTFSKDLLEFGSNQGWDSTKYGSNDWVYQSNVPERWSKLVTMAGEFGLNVLPYYEYHGSVGGKGLGSGRRCQTLAQEGKGPKGRDDFTHITWSEKANADVTDPDTVEDLRRMFEITIADEAKKAHFLGAWLRPRNSGMPISFSDRCLKLFADKTGRERAPTRKDLQGDSGLYGAYLDWWYDQRREFFLAMRDYLRSDAAGIGAEAVLLFTGDPSEPGMGLGKKGIVTEDPAAYPGEETLAWNDVVSGSQYLANLIAPRSTWGGWEWQHSIPALDPQRYVDTPGVMHTLPFNRLYTTSDAKALEAFRTPDGLAIIRHFSLNEHVFGDNKGNDNCLGYFVADVVPAGPGSMLAEARAVANGDPRYIGYLAGNNFVPGFPAYLRAFNQAFLALPALPSTRLITASSHPEVVVREIKTPKDGTWYAVVNTALGEVREVTITVPDKQLTDCCTGNPVRQTEGKATVSLYSGQLLAWHAAR